MIFTSLVLSLRPSNYLVEQIKEDLEFMELTGIEIQLEVDGAMKNDILDWITTSNVKEDTAVSVVYNELKSLFDNTDEHQFKSIVSLVGNLKSICKYHDLYMALKLNESIGKNSRNSKHENVSNLCRKVVFYSDAPFLWLPPLMVIERMVLGIQLFQSITTLVDLALKLKKDCRNHLFKDKQYTDFQKLQLEELYVIEYHYKLGRLVGGTLVYNTNKKILRIMMSNKKAKEKFKVYVNEISDSIPNYVDMIDRNYRSVEPHLSGNTISKINKLNVFEKTFIKDKPVEWINYYMTNGFEQYISLIVSDIRMITTLLLKLESIIKSKLSTTDGIRDVIEVVGLDKLLKWSEFFDLTKSGPTFQAKTKLAYDVHGKLTADQYLYSKYPLFFYDYLWHNHATLYKNLFIALDLDIVEIPLDSRAQLVSLKLKELIKQFDVQ